MSFKSTSYLNAQQPPAFPRISACSRTPGLSTCRSDKSNRIRRIILSNKKSLNNAVESMAKQAAAIADSHELSGRSHETFSSFSKMPNIGDSGSQLVCQLGPSKTIISNSESILIKNPFKHSQLKPKLVQESSSSNTNQPGRHRPSSPKTNHSNCQLKPIINHQGIDQFSQYSFYNPSTNLILKTAHSINEFVDFFEKNRGNTTHQTRPKGCRLSRYAGLKPLSCVPISGPAINNCLGVVIEPKEGEGSLQLRELYELKLKQLARKRAMAAKEPTFSTPDKQIFHLPHLDRRSMAQTQIEVQLATPTRELTPEKELYE